jgi:hypothetical protein
MMFTRQPELQTTELNGRLEDWLRPMSLGIAATTQVRRELTFVQLPQPNAYWCWAAMALSVLKFYKPGNNRLLCGLVNEIFQLKTCCQTPTPTQCLDGYDTGAAMNHLSVLAQTNAGPPDYRLVVAEIDNNRPVAVDITWFAGGGHSLSIYGYLYDNQQQIFALRVGDPWQAFGNSWVPYDLFPGCYHGGASWSLTHWSKSP